MDENNKLVIPGAIFVYTCNKYKNTRLKELKLENEYLGWKVFFIIGDITLETEYKFKIEEETNRTFLYLKCEDSYIHLLKKVVLTMKIIYDNYVIENGILRCGDDLIINEEKLINFINKEEKGDFMGVISYNTNPISKKIENFIPDYYASHKDELDEISLTLDDVQKLNEIPLCHNVGGVIVYLSNKSCKILIDEMIKLDWNIFEYTNEYGYPYIIEDIGVGFILNNNNIYPTYCKLYSNDSNELNDSNTENVYVIAVHTNNYK